MTMNIVNGDGVNITGGNKVIYFNDYELEVGTLEYIPFSFEVKTTHPISKMELYVSGETSPVAEYDFSVSDTAPLGNSAPNGLEYTYTSKVRPSSVCTSHIAKYLLYTSPSLSTTQ